jgi:hypothetical protein
VAILNFQTVSFVWSNFQPRNGWVFIASIGDWRQIRRDNADAVTNILELAAVAKGTGRLVDLEIDNTTNQIQWITLR